MKKFIIRDEDKEYEVEEIETTEKKDESVVEKPTETHDEASLSEEDIAALKKLAVVADKLVGLVNKTDGCSATDEDEDESDMNDADPDEDEVIDTETVATKPIRKDSKASFGSIEQRTKTSDSIDEQEAIAAAWAKRYGGNK